jgi:hypothetical protein
MNTEIPTISALVSLAKPANTLIEKISGAIGGIYKPCQIAKITKAETEASLIQANAKAEISLIQAKTEAEASLIQAKAEVEASLIQTQGDIKIANLRQRAKYRFIEEETKRQANIEAIIYQALPNLEENSKPEDIEDDWITNFFDKCRIVSDKEMQSLWSKILSSEANTPGKYSKRTVNFVSSLDKSEALLFIQLCGYGWQVGEFTPVIYDIKNEIYNKNGINFDTLSHLESIGLICCNLISGYDRIELPPKITVNYYGQMIELKTGKSLREKNLGNIIEFGHVILTKMGKELASICDSQPVEGFMEYILEQWEKMNYLSKGKE